MLQNRFDLYYLVAQIVGLATVGSDPAIGPMINNAFNVHWGMQVVLICGLIVYAAGKYADRLKNPSPPAGTQTVLTPSSAVPPPVATLTTPSAAADATKGP